MTLECTQSKVIFRGGEETRVFPIPFPVLDKTHLQVEAEDSGGTAVSMLPGRDYEWVVENGGWRGPKNISLKLANAMPPGREITVRRVLPLTQDCVFTNQGPNSPNVTEYCFDRGVMLAQQLDEQLRALGEDTDRTEVSIRSLETSVTAHAESLGKLAVEKVSREEIQATLTDATYARNAAKALETAVSEQAMALANLEADKAPRAEVRTIENGLTVVKTSLQTLAGNVSGQATALSGLEAGKASREEMETVENEVAAVKASVQNLAGSVSGQTTALSALAENKASREDLRKVEEDLSALSQNTAKARHAGDHAATGTDPLTPEAIGALSRDHLLLNEHPQYLLRTELVLPEFFRHDPVTGLLLWQSPASTAN